MNSCVWLLVYMGTDTGVSEYTGTSVSGYGCVRLWLCQGSGGPVYRCVRVEILTSVMTGCCLLVY